MAAGGVPPQVPDQNARISMPRANYPESGHSSYRDYNIQNAFSSLNEPTPIALGPGLEMPFEKLESRSSKACEVLSVK